jgi:cytochrome c oxidase assembly protein subunit 15
MLDKTNRDHKIISAWLLAGVILVFVQILLGGITRLTGSGLSITRWEIVTGTIPPLNDEQWMEAFELYKATPQYKQINEGMSLSHFKFIFFWEYFHRLWARMMGFVFAVPFLIFLIRRSLPRKLLKRLGMVILLAALAAVFGWVMVASGLINRPWVNAYKLTIHLGLGISLFIYLFYTWLSHKGYRTYPIQNEWRKGWRIFLVFLILQILFGGVVSGMKAALAYPTWPLMHGYYLPPVILESGHWNTDSFLLYDKSLFMPALVQFIHRNLGYITAGLGIYVAVQWLRKTPSDWHRVAWGLIGIIVVQVLLGIMTLLNSIGSIPVLYGTLHQSFGIILLTYVIYMGIVTRIYIK